MHAYWRGKKVLGERGGLAGYGCICLLTGLCLLFPARCLAGVEGYMVVKDNETILDPKSGTAISWQNRIWITEDKVRIENSQEKDRVLLVHMDTGRLYQLDTQEKTYKTLEFPEGLKDLYGKGELKSEMMKREKKCGEWDCYGVMVRTSNEEISLTTEYWLTKQVDIPFALRKKIANYFGPDQVRLTEELSKYEGYPIETLLTMKVSDKEIRMASKVLEIKKMEMPSEKFEIPAGFKPVEDALIIHDDHVVGSTEAPADSKPVEGASTDAPEAASDKDPNEAPPVEPKEGAAGQ
ncbi:MAG: DUF4412 domain-containing protein [bacterium]